MKPEVKALIIDDEAMACDMLAYLIEHHVPAITAIKKATNAGEGMEIIKHWRPELLFLDVQMPFGDGFDLLKAIDTDSFSIIFTTAYNRYAIKAIRHNALDYLLKPVDADELKQAVDRHFKNRQRRKGTSNSSCGQMLQPGNDEEKPFKIALPTSTGIRLVRPVEILLCKGINNYTQLYLRDNTCITISRTLKDFVELLTKHGFIRAHKSYLVNGSCITEITKNSSVRLIDGREIVVARRKKAEVYKALNGRLPNALNQDNSNRS